VPTSTRIRLYKPNPRPAPPCVADACSCACGVCSCALPLSCGFALSRGACAFACQDFSPMHSLTSHISLLLFPPHTAIVKVGAPDESHVPTPRAPQTQTARAAAAHRQHLRHPMPVCAYVLCVIRRLVWFSMNKHKTPEFVVEIRCSGTRECLPANKPWDVVSATRHSSGLAPRACVRVYARMLVPPNLYIHTYRSNSIVKKLLCVAATVSVTRAVRRIESMYACTDSPAPAHARTRALTAAPRQSSGVSQTPYLRRHTFHTDHHKVALVCVRVRGVTLGLS